MRRLPIALLAAFSLASCTEKPAPPPPPPPPAVEPDRDIPELKPSAAPPERQLIVDLGDLDAIKARGRLRVLVYGQGEDVLPRAGASTTAEEQTAELLATHLGIQTELISVDKFNDLIPLLLEGKGDLIAARMTVTKARATQVAFTRAVSSVEEVLVTKQGGKAFASPADLAGVTVSVRPSSSYRETLDMVRAKDAPTLVIADADETKDEIALIHDVTQGAIEATVVDSDLVAHVQAYEPSASVALTLRAGREIAFAVRPSNKKLKAAADTWLVERTLTATRDRIRKIDFDEVKKRGSLRVLSRNNAVSYFLYKGVQRGFDYDILALFAKEHGLRLELVVPENSSDLIPWLLEGEGDVIAASMTVTPERQAQVWFGPLYNVVDEVVVQRASDPPIASLADLRGKTVHVRPSSSYRKTLDGLKAEHGFQIADAPEHQETEDLIGDVAEGKVPLTVADSTIASVEDAFRDDISIGVAVAANKEIAIAARPDAPLLQKALSAFVTKHVKRDETGKLRGSTDYNVLKKQYFENARRAQEATTDFKETGKLSPYDDLIRQYSSTYGLDWRLMAAQAYQESRFNPDAKSWVGALGLFQVMPKTGAEMGFMKLTDPAEGTHAGIRYMAQLIDSFDKSIPFKHRVRFALASYNAGRGHVEDARRLAKEQGLNPNKWFKNVETTMLQLEDPKVHRHTRHGYCRGSEPVQYVSEISLRYGNYVSIVPDPGSEAAAPAQ